MEAKCGSSVLDSGFQRQTLQFQKPHFSNSSKSQLESPKTIPIKKLSHQEMHERKAKGLCYNCDKKYSSNHNCKAKFLLLLTEDSSVIEANGDSQNSYAELEHILEELDDSVAISYHAMPGSIAPCTLRFNSSINNTKVVVLVDSRSTHNFM